MLSEKKEEERKEKKALCSSLDEIHHKLIVHACTCFKMICFTKNMQHRSGTDDRNHHVMQSHTRVFDFDRVKDYHFEVWLLIPQFSMIFFIPN